MNLQERFQLFIKKATAIHGSKYDYSKVEYTNSTNKITIGCNNCQQEFQQSPMSHISSAKPCGCPHCRYTRRIQPKPYTTLTTDQFIAKANIKHSNKYNYDLVTYVNSRTAVSIVCPYHCVFEQSPNSHLSGSGCRWCEDQNKKLRNNSRKLSIDEYTTRANLRYKNRYDYTDAIYTSSNLPITIRCPIHGYFTVAKAEKHLTGQECPTCCKTNGSSYELRIKNWLDQHGIVYEREKTFVDCLSPISGRKLKYDFFIPSHNLLIEFDGVQHFKPVRFFNQSSTFEKIQIHDITKTEYASVNGHSLLRLNISNIDLFCK